MLTSHSKSWTIRYGSQIRASTEHISHIYIFLYWISYVPGISTDASLVLFINSPNNLDVFDESNALRSIDVRFAQLENICLASSFRYIISASDHQYCVDPLYQVRTEPSCASDISVAATDGYDDDLKNYTIDLFTTGAILSPFINVVSVSCLWYSFLEP